MHLVGLDNFTYLGVVFTTRLSASKHADHIVAKCAAKIGILFSTLPLTNIPLSVAIDIFNIYILPVFTYALPVWFPKITTSSRTKIDAVFTKFLKRYLGLPYLTNNATVHFLTNTMPLHRTLSTAAETTFYKISFPDALSGIHLSPPLQTPNDPAYSPVENIPPHFWLSAPITGNLPILPAPRRALLYDTLDIHHHHICLTKQFHLGVEDDCVCKFCKEKCSWYHYRDCPGLKSLSPCARLRKTFSIV